LNYAYGKFAQGNEVTKLFPLEKAKLKGGDTILFDLVLRKEKTKYPRYANCVWACHVTAYARHTLYQGLQAVSKNARLLYCDTDSILYQAEEMQIPHSTELGAFKFEGEFSYAHFKLPKLYRLDPKNEAPTYRAKGVPRQVASDMFETGKAQFRKPNKLRETLRRNLNKTEEKKMIPNYWELRDKETRQKYDKRNQDSEGNTFPITLK
jgi:hypothetical protein